MTSHSRIPAQSLSMAITVEYLQSIAVSITPGSRPTLLHPQNAEAQKTVENRVVSHD